MSLRIFADGISQPADSLPPSGFGLAPQMKLREFWIAYLKPMHLINAAPGSIKKHLATLNHWEEGTPNPGLWRITDQTISQFRGHLAKCEYRGEPLSLHTQKNHLVNLQFMLDRAGPQRRRDLPTAKLLADIPAIPKPAIEDDEIEDCFTLVEIEKYLAGCQHMRFPLELDGIQPCTFWRCAGLLAYNTALRLKTLLALRWEWEKPDDLGTWFDIPAWAMKRNRRFKCYFSPAAVRILARLRKVHPERVLPWDLSEDWFHKCRRKLMAHTSIELHRQFGFHAFRKACATELGMVNGFAASLQLGHRTKNVTISNYAHRRLLVDAHTKLRQPIWDGDLDGKQGFLFG